jgi:hypothetical protein
MQVPFFSIKYPTLLAAIASLLFAVNTSCGNLKEKGYDTKAIADEVKNREIKHVTPAQLEAACISWGEKITKSAQQNLVEVITEALSSHPIEEAADYCQVNRLLKADSLSQVYRASLKRSNLRDLSASSPLMDKERQILEAYLYNAENKLEQRSNVQRIGDQVLLYTAPIILQETICLRCHGEVGKDITPADFQKLTARYKLDSLSNRRTNDLLGMWHVSFSKKEMIKNMDVK